MIEAVANWIDRRVAGSEWATKMLRKVFPENWSFLFGEIAMYCFVILVITGTFLALFFEGSHDKVVYKGAYGPLNGVQMTGAYASTIKLSFDIRAGLLFRQMHHWAALLFVAAITVHACRIFFTGAFRRPREINWVIGVTLLIMGLVEGFAGYSLPDDLLSGTGLRIAYAIAESIPLIGSWLASLVFGGLYPGDYIIGRLYMLHIFVVPGVIGALVGLHLALVIRQYHTQFPGEGRTDRNVVGVHLWPSYTVMSVALFMFIFAVIAGLGGLVQINPVWFYGPYDPFLVSIGSQPDWYMGWLEGALRIFPPWEFRSFGFMVPNPFFPAALLPGLTFLGMYLYPWIEQRLTGDFREHHLLDRPRDRPIRTAFGCGVLAFYLMLTISGSNDVLALLLGVPINGMVWVLRFATLVLPLVVAWIAYHWCRNLAEAKKRPPAAPDNSGVDTGDGPARDREEVPAGGRSWRLAFADGGVAAGLLTFFRLRRGGHRKPV